jgi:CRISPR/Cas system-associated exonuclease Cas4 (RecB family)
MEQKKYPFSWEPGWSYSRMNTLRICLRLYWYEYYAKRFAPPGENKLILELKNLSKIPFELGNAVHGTIAEILEDLKVNDCILEEEIAKDMAVQKFEILVTSKPLIEKRLGVPFTSEEREKAHEQIRTSIGTFYDSEWLQMLQDSEPITRRNWLIDPPGFGEFRIDGKKAYAKPDLVFSHGGRNYLVEWKSGKPHRDQNLVQVQAYMFYAKDIMGLELGATVGAVHYLTHPEEEPLVIEGKNLDSDEIKNTIKSEIKLIESLCEDVSTNTPKSIGHFPKTDVAGYCRLCNYREICKPDFINNIKIE